MTEAAVDAIAPEGAFVQRFVVEPEQLSTLVPHLNNVEIVRWIDRVAEAHLDHAGWPRRTLAADGVMWFVARHEIDYRGEAFANDAISAITWVESYGRTTCLRATRLVRDRDARLLVAARTRWAHVDLSSRRPTRIPEAVLRAVPALGEFGTVPRSRE